MRTGRRGVDDKLGTYLRTASAKVLAEDGGSVAIRKRGIVLSPSDQEAAIVKTSHRRLVLISRPIVDHQLPGGRRPIGVKFSYENIRKVGDSVRIFVDHATPGDYKTAIPGGGYGSLRLMAPGRAISPQLTGDGVKIGIKYLVENPVTASVPAAISPDDDDVASGQPDDFGFMLRVGQVIAIDEFRFANFNSVGVETLGQNIPAAVKVERHVSHHVPTIGQRNHPLPRARVTGVGLQ